MHRVVRLAVLGLLVWWGVTPREALADEFRPAYLQLTQIDADTYDVLWRLPALDESTLLKLRPEFPPGARALAPVHTTFAQGVATQRWRIEHAGGLAGQAVRFPDLAPARTELLVRLLRSDGTAQLARVPAHDPRFVVTASPGTLEVVQTYTGLGMTHILGGFDHLLFVAALLMLVDGRRRLLATVTAFTVAHSLTLAAATLGLLRLPGPPVEAAIALSIVFVAVEIVHARQGRPGLTQRRPWLVAFGFGLLHGLGFAGALAELGLPPLSIPAALLCFNLGVEIGQLLFIAAVLAVLAGLRRLARQLGRPLPTWGWRLPAYAIGSLASFWLLQRLAAF